MGPLTEIHQCEVDAPMVFRLWMGNLKNVVATFVAHIIIIIIIKIMKMQRQDSVPRPTVRAIVPQQARVPVSHEGIKRHSSSTELSAQYV